MMTVEDLIEELRSFPKSARVVVAVEVVEKHDVRVVQSDIDKLKFEDEDVVVELG